MNDAFNIYGLRLTANCPLPGLPAARLAVREADDVRFELCEPPLAISALASVHWGSPLVETGAGSHRIWSGAGDSGTFWRLAYGKQSDPAVDFIVNPTGSQIWAFRQTPPGLDPVSFSTITTLLIGSVLAVALRLRGTLCLHASAVAIGSHAVVLMGAKGAGKSTLAAALAERGHAVLSDDLAAIQADEGSCQVHAGYPRLRLWPSALEALQQPAADLPPVLPTVPKRYLTLASSADDGEAAPWRFEQRPRHLDAIYLISREPDRAVPEIDAVSAPDRLLALRAEVSARFLALDPPRHAREFRALGHLTLNVPVVRLRSPEGLEQLPAVCALIEKRTGRALSGAA